MLLWNILAKSKCSTNIIIYVFAGYMLLDKPFKVGEQIHQDFVNYNERRAVHSQRGALSKQFSSLLPQLLLKKTNMLLVIPQLCVSPVDPSHYPLQGILCVLDLERTTPGIQRPSDAVTDFYTTSISAVWASFKFSKDVSSRSAEADAANALFINFCTDRISEEIYKPCVWQSCCIHCNDDGPQPS